MFHKQPPGIEGHGQALAAALRVPHHPHPPVACFIGSLQRLGQCPVHRVELVVPGDLLGQDAAAFVLEDNEVADEI
jgi:hypothetical protein